MEGPQDQHNSDYAEYVPVSIDRRARALAWLRPPYTLLDVALAVVSLATLCVVLVWTAAEVSRNDVNRAIPLGVYAVVLAVTVIAGPNLLERFAPGSGTLWVAFLLFLSLLNGGISLSVGNVDLALVAVAVLAVVSACTVRHRSLFSLPSPPLSSTKGTNR